MSDNERAGAGRLRMAAMHLLRFREEVGNAARLLGREVDGMSAIGAAMKLTRPEDATALPIAEVFALFGVDVTNNEKGK